MPTEREKSKVRPVHEVRLGRIKAAIWENQTENGTRHNVTFSRLYKDADAWKDSDSFGRDDLLVLAKAVAAVNAVRGERGFVEHLRSSSDPTILAVLAEDGVACLGVVVAAAGVLLSWATGSSWPDVVATFLIGLMMGFIALWLGYRNRDLILGRAIPSDVQDACVAFLEGQPAVQRVHGVKTRIVGAAEFRFHAEIDWNGSWFGERQADWLAENAGRLGDDAQRRALARELGERLTEDIGDETDRIEAELLRRHPELRHLELEGD